MSNPSTNSLGDRQSINTLNESAVGFSLFLAALPVAFALVALWLIKSTYDPYRGRTDLDMPEWFAINFDLFMKVLPLGLLCCVCLLVSAVCFAMWYARAHWLLRAGFIMQWWVAVVVTGLVLWSSMP